MAVPFELRCLGRPALLAPSGTAVRFRTKKHLALLIFLAVEPRGTPHRRDRLAELLWGSATSAEGRHSLATALSVLRGKLGPDGIDADRDFVRLTTASLRLDLERLAAGDILGSELVPPLDVGDFLEDFEPADAHGFSVWREQQRARWLPAIADALVRLMDLGRRTGNAGQLERLADQMLALDDLSEQAVRAKMESRALAGDRLTALKLYETWKRSLAQQLGAEPSALVEGMALRLRRRGWERPTASEIPTVPTDHWKGRPFVGRGPQYRALYEAWESTLQGAPRHALVIGDSGVGKSTLIERVATAAGLEGAAVTRVQCYEVERQVPYAALAGLLRDLLDRPGASAAPPDALAEIARTVPDVRERYPSIPEAADSDGETARVRLADAVTHFVSAIAEEHPVILVVDDLHLADDASVALLHLVLRRLGTERVMTLMALRPPEAEESPNVSRLRARHGHLGMHGVQVPPMTAEESAELLGHILAAAEDAQGRGPEPAARRAIVRAAAGYPMALELLARDWIATGDRCLALTMGAMTEHPGRGGPPESAYRLGLQRLAQTLDPTTRHVLNLSAVLGQRLNDFGMYGLVDLSAAETMAALARLTALRVLRDSGQDLEFTNELVRAQVYLEVPSPLRRALHEKVAARLLAEERRGAHVPGLEIAWHCIRAGRVAEATPHLLRGGREAIRRGAPAEAEWALASALEHLTGEEREEVVLLLAEVLQEQARWKDSLKYLREPEAASDPRRAAMMSVLQIRAKRFAVSLSDKEAEGLIIDLIESGRRASYLPAQTRALITAAAWLEEVRDEGLLAECYSVTRSIAIEKDEPDLFLELCLAGAMALYGMRRLTECRNMLGQALAIRESNEIGGTLAIRVLTGLGALDCALADYTSALHHYTAAHNIARKMIEEQTTNRIEGNLALCYGRVGLYDLQVSWANRLLASLPANGSCTIELQAVFESASGSAMLGNSEAALKTLQHQWQYATDSGPTWAHQARLLLTADVLRLAGRRAEALAVAAKAVGLSNGTLAAESHAGVFARWVALLGERGHMDNAGEVLDDLMTTRHRFDKLDQLEILNATVWYHARVGKPVMKVRGLMLQELGAMSVGVPARLERLGMLEL